MVTNNFFETVDVAHKNIRQTQRALETKWKRADAHNSSERTDPENDHRQPEQDPESFSRANTLTFTSEVRQTEQHRLKGSTAATYSNCSGLGM